jgi:hypothetical protein
VPGCYLDKGRAGIDWYVARKPHVRAATAATLIACTAGCSRHRETVTSEDGALPAIASVASSEAPRSSGPTGPSASASLQAISPDSPCQLPNAAIAAPRCPPGPGPTIDVVLRTEHHREGKHSLFSAHAIATALNLDEILFVNSDIGYYTCCATREPNEISSRCLGSEEPPCSRARIYRDGDDLVVLSARPFGVQKRLPLPCGAVVRFLGKTDCDANAPP